MGWHALSISSENDGIRHEVLLPWPFFTEEAQSCGILGNIRELGKRGKGILGWETPGCPRCQRSVVPDSFPNCWEGCWLTAEGYLRVWLSGRESPCPRLQPFLGESTSSEWLLKVNKDLAILNQLRMTVKGCSSSRATLGVGWGCHWSWLLHSVTSLSAQSYFLLLSSTGMSLRELLNKHSANYVLESASGGIQPVTICYTQFEFFFFVFVNFCHFSFKMYLGNFFSVSYFLDQRNLGLKETLLAIYLVFFCVYTFSPYNVLNLNLLNIFSGFQIKQ